MQTMLLIGTGGAVGALFRYVLSGLAYRFLGPSFPWGTLTVNILGCLIIGLVWAMADGSRIPPGARVFLITGVLGAFTTFSTFGLDTINLFRDGHVGLAIANILASNIVGVGAVLAGFFVARLLVPEQ